MANKNLLRNIDKLSKTIDELVDDLENHPDLRALTIVRLRNLSKELKD